MCYKTLFCTVFFSVYRGKSGDWLNLFTGDSVLKGQSGGATSVGILPPKKSQDKISTVVKINTILVLRSNVCMFTEKILIVK